jgi:hypothetical protein
MDWQPTPARDHQTSSSSSEEEDRPHRVFGRRRQAQAPGIPPPLRDEPQAARHVIEVVIPVRQEVPPGADLAPGQDVAHGQDAPQDVDAQHEQQIRQEQAAVIVGEQEYQLLQAMVPTMRQLLAAHVSKEQLDTFLRAHMERLNALILEHPKEKAKFFQSLFFLFLFFTFFCGFLFSCWAVG